jgi:hypothetical protein
MAELAATCNAGELQAGRLAAYVAVGDIKFRQSQRGHSPASNERWSGLIARARSHTA